MSEKKRGSKITFRIGKDSDLVWRQGSNDYGFYAECGVAVVSPLTISQAKRLAEWILARIEQCGTKSKKAVKK